MAEPVKSGTISQICLIKDNKYYDVCDAKSREDIASLINKIYPIGSIYMTMNNNFKPQDAFGGTWQKIQGSFLLGTSNNEVTGGTGGHKEVTLQANQIPIKPHTHSMQSHTHDIGHTHDMWHTHSIDHTHKVDIGAHAHDFNDFQENGHHCVWMVYSSRVHDHTGSNGGYTEGGMYNGQGVLVTNDHSPDKGGVHVQPYDYGTKPTGGPTNQNSGADSRADHKTGWSSKSTSGGPSLANTGEAIVPNPNETLSPINILPPYITVHIWQRTA